MRIFVAGFQHETNTFAPSKADWAAFESGAGYPPVSHGAPMLESIGRGSLPMGGFIREAHRRGWTLLPSIWAGAVPSAHVTADSFERIADTIVDDARRALQQTGFDAVALDLHGAAVAEHVDDAEGELLGRLRAVIGPEMPLVASLDLHANVTKRMLRHATALTAFRTYPHVDMPETGARAVALLAELADAPRPWRMAAWRIPFLLPLNSQCTLTEPARSLYAELERIEAASDTRLSFAMGFPAADFEECGPVVFGHGRDLAALQRAVDTLYDNVLQCRGDFALELLTPAAAVERALALAGTSGTVVIADTQDNPGAGGDSNTTGMLHALRAAGAGRHCPGGVALGLLFDPAAARAAHAAGLGAELDLAVGTSVTTFDGGRSDPPFAGRFKVLALSDGVVPLHGPMTAGGTAQLGLSALVECEGVKVALVSAKAQMLDLDYFRFLGVEPAAMQILVVKSSVHFRAAFAPIAAQILVAQAPGPMAADPADLPWQKLPATTARRP